VVFVAHCMLNQNSISDGTASYPGSIREVVGEGVFIEVLRKELEKHNIHVEMAGIKAFEPEKAVKTVKPLIGPIDQ
jgi:hypothetical protein